MGTWIKPTGTSPDDITLQINTDNKLEVKDEGLTVDKIAPDSLADSSLSTAVNSKITTQGYVDEKLSGLTLVSSPVSLSAIFTAAWGVSSLSSIPANSYKECFVASASSGVFPISLTDGYVKLLFRSSAYMEIQYSPSHSGSDTIFVNRYLGAWKGWRSSGVYRCSWDGSTSSYLLDGAGNSVSITNLISLSNLGIPVFLTYNSYNYELVWTGSSSALFRCLGGTTGDETISTIRYNPTGTTRVEQTNYKVEDKITTIGTMVSSNGTTAVSYSTASAVQSILNISLAAGTWIVSGDVAMNMSSSDGYKRVGLDTSTSTAVDDLYYSCNSTDKYPKLGITGMYTFSSAVTMHLVIQCDGTGSCGRRSLRAIRVK